MGFHGVAKNICSLITRRHPSSWAVVRPGTGGARERLGATTIKFRNNVNWTGTLNFRYFPAANKMSKKTFHSVLGHGSQPSNPGRNLSPLLSSVLARASLFLTSLYTCTVEATHVHTCANCTPLLLYKNIQFSPGIMIVS